MNPEFSLRQAKTDADFQSLAVNFLVEIIVTAIDVRGFAVIGLSGGSTPRPMYEALGQSTKIDWTKAWVFLVDDRYVPADNPNSNQFLLRSTLLKHAPIPESQLIFPDTTLPFPECVDLYDRHLSDLLRKGAPDVVTLGMGDDGHIASLFPPLAPEAFGPTLAIGTETETFSVKKRISVTLPALIRARQSVFFLKGAEKRRVWEEMLESADDEKRWPAKAVIHSTTTAVIGQW